MDRKIIIINEHIKGRLVYAERKTCKESRWLVLIKEVSNGKCIERIISYNYELNAWLFSKGEADVWSKTAFFYDFYEPTEEEIKMVVNKLAEYGFKFIPILNQVIKKR